MEGSGERGRLVDFPAVGGRVRVAAGVLAMLALIGVVVDGLIGGLTFAVMLGWAAGYVAALLLGVAAIVAYSAYRGADQAGRRGERLSSRDVGLTPRRGRHDQGA